MGIRWWNAETMGMTEPKSSETWCFPQKQQHGTMKWAAMQTGMEAGVSLYSIC